MTVRRYAAHTVSDGAESFAPGVVEIEAGHVVRIDALRGEEAFTTWLGGKIEIKADGHGHKVAIHNGKPLKQDTL